LHNPAGFCRYSGQAFRVPLAFSDAEKLAQDSNVDLVTVSVKVPDHYLPVMAAIEAGKHVYCEWPLGRNTDEAAQMLAAAERRGVRHAVGLQGQVSPAICYAKDLIAEGYVGRVLSATMIGCAPNCVMVAKPGIGILCKAVDMSLVDWRRQTAVNLDGVFRSVKYAVPAMRRTGGGSIIIMSSVAGLRGSAGLAGYCATKGGVRLFANAIAMECLQLPDGCGAGDRWRHDRWRTISVELELNSVQSALPAPALLASCLAIVAENPFRPPLTGVRVDEAGA
jgi:NAD(P)-dependent dehydrogenase (short-subunit alcohol dehydrogenase family)